MARKVRSVDKTSLLGTVLWMGPLVLFIFFAGVYVGSSHMHNHPSASVDVPGSIGTTFQTLQSSNHQLLRRGDTSIVEEPLTALKSNDISPAADSPSLPSMTSSEDQALSNARLLREQNYHLQPPPPPPEQQQQPVSKSESQVVIKPQEHSNVEKRHSFQFGGDDSYLMMPASMDGKSLAISLWVYLGEVSSTTGTMLTIFSNKKTGCSPMSGYALYVNEWETSDRQLVLEIGNSESGCVKIGSKQTGAQVPMKKWFHVFVSMLDNNRIDLYLDNSLVAFTTHKNRQIETSTPLKFGQYPEGSYPIGAGSNISNLVFMYGLRGLELNHVETLSQITMNSGDKDLIGNGNLEDLSTTNSVKNQLTTLIQQMASKSGVLVGNDDADNLKVMFYPLNEGLQAQFALDIMHLGESDAGSKVKGEYHRGWQHGARGSSRGSGGSGGSGGGVSGKYQLGLDGFFSSSSSKEASDEFGRSNAQLVKNAMKHAWSGYKRYAWGRDELKPISGKGGDPWGGIGCTMVDSLDVLWIMGMKEEFSEAQQWVAQSLRFDRTGRVSVFETTIRELGGLLAAFDFSGEPVFLDKAEDLGRRLLKAFNSPSGIPYSNIDLSRGGGGGGGTAVLAELGTLQIDFRYLSEMTGDPSFARAVNKVFDLMCSKSPPRGLYPIHVRLSDGGFADRSVTFGALGDSFYEYLLKVWVQGGQKEDVYKRTFERAMDGMFSTVFQSSTPSKLAYIADWDGNRLNHKMDHLVCFMGGLLALSAHTAEGGPEGSATAMRDLEAGKALTYTCYQMYERMASGVAPEWIQFRSGRDFSPGGGGAHNILRPEAIESIFILHQLTGDPIYRQWGRKMFDSLEKHCRTNIAYGGLRDVQDRNARPEDRMESFFLAETLKYHYLLQSPLEDHGIDLLRTHVFNTEAHPLSIFGTDRFNELKQAMERRRQTRHLA